MRLMHGEAWAESSATGGARFVIALPVLDENDSSTW
jgi:signal transduction histidine kinase